MRWWHTCKPWAARSSKGTLHMDVNPLRLLATLACFATFVGIWYWAYARKNKDRFEQYAHSPSQQN